MNKKWMSLGTLLLFLLLSGWAPATLAACAVQYTARGSGELMDFGNITIPNGLPANTPIGNWSPFMLVIGVDDRDCAASLVPTMWINGATTALPQWQGHDLYSLTGTSQIGVVVEFKFRAGGINIPLRQGNEIPSSFTTADRQGTLYARFRLLTRSAIPTGGSVSGVSPSDGFWAAKGNTGNTPLGQVAIWPIRVVFQSVRAVNTTCNYASHDVTADLGDYDPTTFTGVGFTTPLRPVDIVSTGCNVDGLTMSFADAMPPAGQGVDNFATNVSGVGVQLFRAVADGGDQVFPADQIQMPTKKTAGERYGFQANLIQTTNTVGSGQGRAEVTVTIDYH
jgi:type 1 fimbria pilin